MKQTIKLCEKHIKEATKLQLPMTIFAHSKHYCSQCNYLKNKAILQGDHNE